MATWKTAKKSRLERKYRRQSAETVDAELWCPPSEPCEMVKSYGSVSLPCECVVTIIGGEFVFFFHVSLTIMDTDTSVDAMPKQLDILDFWLVRLVHQSLVLFKLTHWWWVQMFLCGADDRKPLKLRPLYTHLDQVFEDPDWQHAFPSPLP